jgi:hypothetical protein
MFNQVPPQGYVRRGRLRLYIAPRSRPTPFRTSGLDKGNELLRQPWSWRDSTLG